MFTVYLDESGYTGADLINLDQPVYSFAAVTLADEVAREIVARCFPSIRTNELKHSKLSSGRRGRESVLAFIHALTEHPTSASITVMHKEFVLVGMLVDFWIEVDCHREHVDLYEGGANIGLANITYLTLGVLLGDDGRREFLRRFQVMVRDRSVFAYESFWSTLDDLRKRHPRFDDDLFGMYAVANARLGGFRHLLSLPDHMLDMGDYALLQTVSHWRGKTTYPLRLIHDNAATLVRNRERWNALLSNDAPPTIVGHDRRTIRFPLDATLELADSASHVQLQLADIIAGAAATLVPGAGRKPKHEDYVEALRESPLLKASSVESGPPTRYRPRILRRRVRCMGTQPNTLHRSSPAGG